MQELFYVHRGHNLCHKKIFFTIVYSSKPNATLQNIYMCKRSDAHIDSATSCLQNLYNMPHCACFCITPKLKAVPFADAADSQIWLQFNHWQACFPLNYRHKIKASTLPCNIFFTTFAKKKKRHIENGLLSSSVMFSCGFQFLFRGNFRENWKLTVLSFTYSTILTAFNSWSILIPSPHTPIHPHKQRERERPWWGTDSACTVWTWRRGDTHSPGCPKRRDCASGAHSINRDRAAFARWMP